MGVLPLHGHNLRGGGYAGAAVNWIERPILSKRIEVVDHVSLRIVHQDGKKT